MKLIRALREKSQTKRQEEILKIAEEIVTVADFADSLFIAYDGVPLVPIKDAWTSKDILKELSVVRTNYVNSKMKGLGLPYVASIL